MKWLVACCLALSPVVGTAAQEPLVNIGNDDLLAYLGIMQIEARLDADVTGDGRNDVIYVASNVHERVLGVIAGGEHTAQIGRRAIGEAALDTSPQVPIALGFENGMLSVEDLTGTDTVTLSRYQYRYEQLQNRMRLFALICEQYSPTFSHGSSRLSWNLDEGDHVVEYGHVVTLDTGEDVYVYESENRTSRKTAAVYVEDAPSPAELLGTEVSPRERVATDGSKHGVESP